MKIKFPTLVIFHENYKGENQTWLVNGKHGTFLSAICLTGKLAGTKTDIFSPKEFKYARKIVSIEDFETGDIVCEYCGHKESDGY